ncbi:MAG TPA: hypothetical protein VIL97_03305 [Thermoanaerobaculia bacterium]
MFQRAAAVKSRVEAIPATYGLPIVLTVNTAALVALDRLGAFPAWMKAAAAVFLAF